MDCGHAVRCYRLRAGHIGAAASTTVGTSTVNPASYSYDPINQLHAAGATTYGYDGANNLHTITAATTTTLTNDVANQLSGLSTMNGSTLVQQYNYGYDPEGNRTARTDQNNVVTAYTYDQANRLTGYGASAGYAYNGDGLRMSKTVSGTTTQQTWDVAEGLPLLLKDGTTSYGTGLGGLPLEQINGSTTSYYYQDRLGSTRAIANSSGTVVATKSYDPYGTVTASTGTLVAPFQYAGQYTDAESGLQYLRARFYDPVAGSFLSRDPAAAQTRAPYGYAGNSPVNASDPSGLFDVMGAVNSVVGGVLNAFATPAYAPADEGDLAQLTARGQTQGIGAALPVMDALSTGAMVFGLVDGTGEVMLALRAGALRAAGASGGLTEAFSYTSAESAASIAENGMRAGSWATPAGDLSPLQAQLELALSPERALASSVVRSDVAGLREAGYEIPEVTRVGSVVRGSSGRIYSMPGGGFEMQFPYPIPPEFVSVVR